LSYKVNSSTWCNVDGFTYYISKHRIYIGPSHFQFPLLIFMCLHQENFFHCQLNHTFSLFSFIYTNKRSLSSLLYTTHFLSHILHKSQQQRPTLKRWSTRKIGIWTRVFCTHTNSTTTIKVSLTLLINNHWIMIEESKRITDH
jgi:hypothetical protein